MKKDQKETAHMPSKKLVQGKEKEITYIRMRGNGLDVSIVCAVAFVSTGVLLVGWWGDRVRYGRKRRRSSLLFPAVRQNNNGDGRERRRDFGGEVESV